MALAPEPVSELDASMSRLGSDFALTLSSPLVLTCAPERISAVDVASTVPANALRYWPCGAPPRSITGCASLLSDNDSAWIREPSCRVTVAVALLS